MNDIIAIRSHISSLEAFNLNREELVNQIWNPIDEVMYINSENKHNSLHDALVIKNIYHKYIQS